MADEILHAVARLRKTIAVVGPADDLHGLVAKYARAIIGQRRGAAEKLRQDIVELLAKRWLPDARKAGVESAAPILRALGDAVSPGQAIRSLRRYSRANLDVLQLAIERETGGLSLDIQAAFARARRDGVARRELIDNLLKADRAERAEIEAVRQAIADSAAATKQAEQKLAKSSKRGAVRARRDLKERQRDEAKARAGLGKVETMLGRFETAVLGEIRDSVRRECQRAQLEAFKEAGYTETYVWVSVNGPVSCPQCIERHGKAQGLAEWETDGLPGDGATYCGESCMCQLVPEEYSMRRKDDLRQPMTIPS